MSRRAKRALERQLAYQEAKARMMPKDQRALERELTDYAQSVRARIEKYRPIEAGLRVLEVGSGAHGLVFFMGIPGSVGVDPLAAEYARLFPQWQSRATTVAAFGEALPFEDASFDVVLSDNVIDHAESPRGIVREMARVLKPGGIIYFTVNVHHPIYGVASRLHHAWQYLGRRFEISAFADHTVHLSPAQGERLFEGSSWRILHEEAQISRAREEARRAAPRHVGDRLKRLFFKNARLEIIACRT